jgi:hypothetical protein
MMRTRQGQTLRTLADVVTAIKLTDGIIRNSLLAVDISASGLFLAPNAKPGTRICVAKGVPTA